MRLPVNVPDTDPQFLDDNKLFAYLFPLLLLIVLVAVLFPLLIVDPKETHAVWYGMLSTLGCFDLSRLTMPNE